METIVKITKLLPTSMTNVAQKTIILKLKQTEGKNQASLLQSTPEAPILSNQPMQDNLYHRTSVLRSSQRKQPSELQNIYRTYMLKHLLLKDQLYKLSSIGERNHKK